MVTPRKLAISTQGIQEFQGRVILLEGRDSKESSDAKETDPDDREAP